MTYAIFEWDEAKDAINQGKHGVTFHVSQSSDQNHWGWLLAKRGENICPQ